MTRALDRAGWFRCRVVAWGCKKSEKQSSDAVNVTLQCVVTAAWDSTKNDWDETWSAVDADGRRLYDDHEVYCNVCVVKADGSINDNGVRQLQRTFAWDSDFRVFAGAPPPQQVVLRVEPDDYTDKQGRQVKRFRGTWLHPADHVPSGGVQKDPEDKLAEMNERLGSAVRASLSKQAEETPF